GVALAHGLTIAVMVSATAGISGGHLNPAVSFGLWVGKQIDSRRLLSYWVAQLAGATVAGFLLVILLKDSTLTGAQIVANGTPNLAKDVSVIHGIVIEAILTFFLVFVVFCTGVD